MKPLFTIHGGEFLFGNEVEKRFPNLSIWIPSKDSGIDFLLTNQEVTKSLTIQVKYSRDFNWSHGNDVIQSYVKTTAWYNLKREKIVDSKADYWVFVNYDGLTHSADYIFVKPKELISIFDKFKTNSSNIVMYLAVFKSNKCYETRGLKKSELKGLLEGKLDNTIRDFSPFLENWEILNKHFITTV
ncbi:hypothetical protein [uncultured Arcticibacterium sp.]|uniref:hypothetical protein n=1 Tax=uncultured Arcticibacterium sp. TaxID=2173042 RepID=UPI0030FA7AF0